MIVWLDGRALRGLGSNPSMVIIPFAFLMPGNCILGQGCFWVGGLRAALASSGCHGIVISRGWSVPVAGTVIFVGFE